MRIGLIRHGETDWNAQGRLQGRSDIPLNTHGIDQAQDAARMLVGRDWQRVFTSPLVRAATTAGIIAEALGLPEPQTVPGIVERSFGEAEGDSYWQADGSRHRLDHPTIEPMEAVKARSIAAIHETADAYADEHILIVCHGTVIRFVLDELMDEQAPRISNLALSVLERDQAGQLRVILANGYPRW